MLCPAGPHVAPVGEQRVNTIKNLDIFLEAYVPTEKGMLYYSLMSPNCTQCAEF